MAMKKSFALVSMGMLSSAALGIGPFEDGWESDPYDDTSSSSRLTEDYTSGGLYNNTDLVIQAAGASSYSPDGRPAYVILAYQGYYHASADPILGRRGWWRDNDISNGGDDGYEMGQSGNQLTTSLIPLPAGKTGSAAGNGVVDSVDMLLALLEEGYDMGFRRFIINRPAGFLDGLTDLPNAGWWSIDEALREALLDDGSGAGSDDGGLKWWIDYKNNLAGEEDVSVGVYIGFRAGDPWSVAHSADYLHADRLSDIWMMYRNLKPWHEAGTTQFVFDHVGGITNGLEDDPEIIPRSESLHRLRNTPAFDDLYVIGEHVVLAKKPSGGGYSDSGVLNQVHAGYNPWVIQADRLDTLTVDEDRIWNVPANSEINVFFDYNATNNYTASDVMNFVDRGFTPWAWGASRIGIYDKSVELIRWVYYDSPTSPTMTPWSIADLDADNDVDFDDWCIIYTNANQQKSDAYPWEGDLDLGQTPNGSAVGVVDQDDVTMWINAASADAGYTPPSTACP